MTIQTYSLKIEGTTLRTKLTTTQLGFLLEKVWSPSPSVHGRTKPYAVPKLIEISTRFDVEETGTRFSPPPYAVVVSGRDQRTLVVVKAQRHWHQWTTCEFIVTRTGVEIRVDLEGHTSPLKARDHVAVVILPANKEESDLDLLTRGTKILYPSAFASIGARKIPDWWRRPLFCGGGAQAAQMLELEGGAGSQSRSGAYSVQGLYERWVQRLEEARVPIGTIIVDFGWSQGGGWTPYPNQWPDLKGFIARQHRKGRRVLMWIGTWFYEGLPDAWCIRSGKTKLLADPTNPAYRTFLRKQVQRLISPGRHGYDADGFKVDMLQYTPCERQARGCDIWGGRDFPLPKKHPRMKTYGGQWGCELLYQLQKDIRDAAKSVKPDALINSSTVHPYFHDTFDMVRLHDAIMMDVDIFRVMQARAALAKAVLPNHLIDTDNWIYRHYNKWLDYTLESHRIGVPCIFYADLFPVSFKQRPHTRPIPLKDLREIGRVWRKIFA